MNQKLLLIFTWLLLFLCLPSLAQKENKSSARSKIDTTLYSGLKWRNIGPFRGGRCVAVAGITDQPLVYYMGATGGGMWKTTDAGTTWENISDQDFSTGSVGAIGISPSDPNVIYVGMGEHAVRGVMTSHGDGMYKSTDAGNSWKHIGLPNSHHISDVLVHPQNSSEVYVSVQGPLYAPSTHKGIYKSTDGGSTWQQLLYLDQQTGASSLSMDPTNPRILYAGMWQHQRFPWTMVSGGPGSGIHKSTDGGVTWAKLEEGLPEVMGKVGMSVSPAEPQRVYAVIEAEGDEAGVYRSDDGGKKWKQVSSDRTTIARAWYYIEIEADPQDANTVYVLNSPLLRSVDGGKTFSPLPIPHIDIHDHWINPKDPDIMINGNDGGATITFNGGKTWSTQQNQPTAQFYRVVADDRFPYYLYGGQQDNTSMAIASRTGFIGIGWKDWYPVAGGESAYLAFDPKDPKVVYGTSIQGLISRYDVPNERNKSIQVYPELVLGMIPRDMKYRFNWNPPLVWQPQNPAVMYFGAQKLLRTEDGGITWSKISDDLTRNQLERQGPGGGPFTNEAAGGENYNTIMYIAPSAHQTGTIYVGSDDGLVHLTRDEGKTWNQVTPEGLPESIINCIEVSAHDPASAYLVAMRYKFGDQSPLVYSTSDYGSSWKKITNGFNENSFVRVIREDPKIRGLLYAGTERGFYISFNDGEQWHRLDLNLPPVPITDLTIKDNDLVAATAGRGFWILDDLSALQQSGGNFSTALTLYQPKPTVRYTFGAFAGIQFPNFGTNPPNGVILDYYLREEPDSAELVLKILNDQEQLLRTYTNAGDAAAEPRPGSPPPAPVLPKEQGLNRFSWDLRHETFPGIKDVFISGDFRGHMVAPGKYRAQLMLSQDTVSVNFEVLADPNWDISPQEFSAQQEILNKIDDHIIEIHKSINKMRQARDRLNDLQSMLKATEQYDDLAILGDTLLAKVNRWEQALIQTKMRTQQDMVNFRSKLGAEFMYLKAHIDTHDPRLTNGAQERMKDLEERWLQARDELTRLVEEDFKQYNDLYKEKGVPAVLVD